MTIVFCTDWRCSNWGKPHDSSVAGYQDISGVIMPYKQYDVVRMLSFENSFLVHLPNMPEPELAIAGHIKRDISLPPSLKACILRYFRFSWQCYIQLYLLLMRIES
ncbi:hypothetical protein NE237_007817 [Protea cynaroides]|uniref:Uncharacterized protein n=1 Tax=Protea cynaroides TaxID=273540 RepID=A0A9Q0KPU4_9MAGN|nr:hypothetical protein NE237_007817 [Protea cynaroides]